jgi:hypothetical protein
MIFVKHASSGKILPIRISLTATLGDLHATLQDQYPQYFPSDAGWQLQFRGIVLSQLHETLGQGHGISPSQMLTIVADATDKNSNDRLKANGSSASLLTASVSSTAPNEHCSPQPLLDKNGGSTAPSQNVAETRAVLQAAVDIEEDHHTKAQSARGLADPEQTSNHHGVVIEMVQDAALPDRQRQNLDDHRSRHVNEPQSCSTSEPLEGSKDGAPAQRTSTNVRGKHFSPLAIVVETESRGSL